MFYAKSIPLQSHHSIPTSFRHNKINQTFTVHTTSRMALGTTQPPNPMGTRGSFPGGKVARAWSCPLISTLCQGQRMSGAIHPLPHMSSWCGVVWCGVKHRDNFTLLYFTFTVHTTGNGQESSGFVRFWYPSSSTAKFQEWKKLSSCLLCKSVLYFSALCYFSLFRTYANLVTQWSNVLCEYFNGWLTCYLQWDEYFLWSWMTSLMHPLPFYPNTN
jgi:hypothetical protein